MCWGIGGDAQVCMRVSVTPMTIWIADAAIAQLGERQTEDLKVPGSIPGLGTFASCVSHVRCPLRTSNRHLFGMILRDPQFLMSWLVCWFFSCLRAPGKQRPASASLLQKRLVSRGPQFLMLWLVRWFFSCLRAPGKQRSASASLLHKRLNERCPHQESNLGCRGHNATS